MRTKKPDNLDSALRKHVSIEELMGQFYSKISEMKQNLGSEVQKMTEKKSMKKDSNFMLFQMRNCEHLQ